jgi:outer membrane protein
MFSTPIMRAVFLFSLLIALNSGPDISFARADGAMPPPQPPANAVTSRPLTLMNLTDMALQRNPKTRLAWDAFRVSEAGVALARAGYWPQLSATLSGQRSRALSVSGLPATTQTRYGSSISLSYLLWDFGVRSGTLDQAEFQLESARMSQNQAMQDVILQVEQAYYQTLGLQALVEVNRQSLKDAATNLEAAQERKSAGLATVGDVYKAEAALAGARLSLQQSEGQLAAAHGQLASAVGDTPDTPLQLATWEQVGKPELPAQSVNSLLDAARDARPELLAAKAQEQAAAAKLETTRGRGLPTLNLSANSGHTQVVGVASSSQFNTLLTLNIPIFSGFADRAAVHQAEAQLDSARDNSADLRSQVALQVWLAYQNLRTAAVTLESSDAQLKSAQQAADVSSARYKNGLDSILDLLSSQNTLANARVQKVQSRLDWAAARAALGHAVGGLAAPQSNSE